MDQAKNLLVSIATDMKKHNSSAEDIRTKLSAATDMMTTQGLEAAIAKFSPEPASGGDAGAGGDEGASADGSSPQSASGDSSSGEEGSSGTTVTVAPGQIDPENPPVAKPAEEDEDGNVIPAQPPLELEPNALPPAIDSDGQVITDTYNNPLDVNGNTI